MSVYINGIGILSRSACSKEELETILSGQAPEIRTLPLDFPSEVPSAKLRRNSRYNKLACAAADQALKNAGIPEIIGQGLDEHLIGTILSTGYGAAEYTSGFSDSVTKGDPNGCSPLIFSGTVPNSIVGQICIINRLKGFSTVLTGGDPLEYASLLIKTGRCAYVLAGSVEEYFPPLYHGFEMLDAAKGTDLSEGAAMAVLSSTRTGRTLCEAVNFGSVNLGKCPVLYIPEEIPEAEKKITDVIRQMEKPDVVFSAANGSRFDRTEGRVLLSIFPDVPLLRPKEFFGETLGCGYMMNVVLAAASIQNGIYHSVLVSGFDMIGNYSCVLLKQ